MMNLTRVILIIISFWTSFASAQSDSTKYPKVVVISGDTVTVFSMEQSKELAIRNEKLKECDTLNNICEQQIVEKDTIISAQEGKINNLESAVENYIVIGNNKDDLLGICELEKVDLVDEVKRQKRHKWIAIVSGGIIAVLGILF